MYWIQINRLLIVALLLALTGATVRAGPAEDQYAIAARHYVRQQWRMAVEELELFLQRYPEHDRADAAVFLIGESLVQLERYDEARQRFLAFLEKAPGHQYASQALFRCGETAYLTGKYEDADRDLERLRRDFPDHELHAYALPYLGEMALAAGDAKRAEALFNEALRRFANGPLADECRFGMGRSMEIQGDYQAAERFYQFLAESLNSSLADEAQLQLGVMQHERGDHEQAAKALTAFESRFPDSKLRIDAKYWLGMTQLAQESPEAAAQTLTQAAAPPEHALAAAIEFWAGEALRRNGDVDAARKRYERVLETWPDAQWADDSLQARMQLAFEAGEHELVQSLADQFAQRFADSPLTSLVLQTKARSLLKQERYAEAAEVLQPLAPAAKENSASAEPAGQTSAYYLALAHLGCREYERALSVLDQIKLAGDDRELRDGLNVARASALAGLKRYGEAIAPLRAYLDSQPRGADAAKCQAQLAVSLAKAGRYDEAREAYQRLHDASNDPELVLPTTLCLAETAYSAGERGFAAELFSALGRDGNPPDYVAKGLSGLAWTQFTADGAAESAETFQRLLQQHPDSPLAPEAALMRAQALERLEQSDTALATYHLVLEKYSQSEQATTAQLRAAQLHDRLGQDREAAELLQQLAEQHPDLPNLDAVLYQWAWVLVDLERPDDADELFARIWKDHRESEYWADAGCRLGQRAAESKDHEQAIRLADQIIQSDCDEAILSHALYLRGQSAAALERWSEVAAPMRRILDQFPDSGLALPAEYWIAESLYRQGEYEQAGLQFASLSEKTKGRQDQWLGMIPLRRAQVLAHQKQWQASYELAASISEQFPDFRQQYEVDYLLGRCLGSQGRFGDARAAYERVIRSPEGGRTETAAMAQWMIGESHFHQKQYDEAIRAYYRVESLYGYPRWQAAALLQAGKCHEMKNEWNEAVLVYAQLLKDYADTAFTEEAARRLRVAQKRATTTAAG